MKPICYLFIAFSLYSCGQFNNTTDIQVSDSIEKSKEIDVFLFEMRPDKYQLRVNKINQNLTIEKIWIENIWKLTNDMNKIEKFKSYQMVISFKENQNNDSENILKYFVIKWGLGISPTGYGLNGQNVFIDLGENIKSEYTIKIFEYLEDSNIKSVFPVDSFDVIANKI